MKPTCAPLEPKVLSIEYNPGEQMQNRKTTKASAAHGPISNYTLRTARSGNFAHEFNIGSKRFSLFMEDGVSPFQDGDHVEFEFVEKQLKGGSRRKYLSVVPETLQISVPVSIPMTSSVGGYVYVLGNPSMRGLVKVGYTSGSPEGRAAELSAVTGVPKPFEVKFALPIIGDPRIVEQSTHAILAAYRGGKEFFRIELDKAVQAVRDAYLLTHPASQDQLDSSIVARLAENETRKQAFQEVQAKRADMVAIERFWASPEGRWLTDGTVTLTVKKFRGGFEKIYPGLLQRAFGKTARPWLELQVFGRKNYSEKSWRMILEGVIENRTVSLVRDLDHLSEILTYWRSLHHHCDRDHTAISIKIACALLNAPKSGDYVVQHSWAEVPGNPSDGRISNHEDQMALEAFIHEFYEPSNPDA